MPTYALAIDIGASSGRHMLLSVQQGRLKLEEIYRFPNGAAEKNGHLCWNVDALWGHIVAGMKECKKLGKLPASVGVDTWAVDYVLADRDGRRVGDCVAYRDGRTAPVLERVPFETLYRRTGIAMQPFNTVYQLMATPREELERAERLLMMPDWFHYRLCGRMCNEWTNASSTALLNAQTHTWDAEILHLADIPARLLPEPPRMPGTRLGRLLPAVRQEVGFDCDVILPATHDTGSAFVAVPARDENAATLSSGTWSLLGVENPRPITTDAARGAGFTNEGGYDGGVRFLRNIMGLWMLQCIRREEEERFTFAQMAELARQGGDYPYTVDATDNRFLAPRSMTEEVRAALREQGAPEPEGLPQLLACVNRSLARCYAGAIRDLEELTGRRFTSLNIVGGGAGNRVLNQWTADATGLPVLAGPSEGTALGNGVMQLIALGEMQNVAQARQLIRGNFDIAVFEPHKGEGR